MNSLCRKKKCNLHLMFFFCTKLNLLISIFYTNQIICTLLWKRGKEKTPGLEAFREDTSYQQGLSCKKNKIVNETKIRRVERNAMDKTFTNGGRNNAGTLSIRKRKRQMLHDWNILFYGSPCVSLFNRAKLPGVIKNEESS